MSTEGFYTKKSADAIYTASADLIYSHNYFQSSRKPQWRR